MIASRPGFSFAMLPWLLLVLLLTVAAWIYWPGIAGPSLLDDRSSISVLSGLSDNPGLARDFVVGDNSGLLGRPVSMATFVLEKLYLDRGVTGNKAVNILIHLLNGCLVVWLFALLLRHIQVPGFRWAAVLAGAAWIFSPLYVSTVLYAVQRMAMLATLFTLASCISYLYWRLREWKDSSGLIWLFFAICFGLLAPFAKENAVVLIPIILLMEVLWLQNRGPENDPHQWLRLVTIGLVAGGALFLLILLTAGYDWLVAGYGTREFSLYERVLTQCRILWDYVGQLYWPDVRPMGLYHDDYAVSSSLVQPRSTLFAVMAWIAVVIACIALLFWQWGRYLVFTVCFFLVGHSVESTVLALELYFEHRNYLPGVGLFLALAVIYGWLVRKWPELQAPLLAWMALYVFYLALQTSSQVQVWSSKPLLRLNHVNAHPESFRANTDMAEQMASVGELDSALAYSAKAQAASIKHRASTSERAGDRDVRDLALSCLANKPLPQDRIARIGTVDPERPLGSVNTFHILVRLKQENICPEFDWVAVADRMVEIYLVPGYPIKASANMYSVLAGLENALERYGNAYEYIEKFLTLAPGNTRGLLMKLHFATALAKEEEIEAVKTLLQKMDGEGKLTMGERQNLSFYLEN